MKSSSIKMKGLTSRWLFNIIGIVVLVVVVFQITASLFIVSFYYNSVRRDIDSRIRMSSGFFMRYAAATEMEFELGAKEFVGDYLDKNTVEVQVFDRNDNMIVTSGGFISNQQSSTDYEAAKKQSGGKAEAIYTNENGENVMAVTMFLPKVNDRSIGAIRFVVCMDAINKQILNNIIIILCIGLFIIALTVASGALFLRSIIKPIRAITDTAYRIANGNFDDRLPVNGTDEIGKLCDTINYMASELESSETLKNEFISSVSHELRTPLTVIQGWGETIKTSIETDPQLVEKGMNVIINESSRLSGLVEDLLDFSRMQAGRLTLNMQKVDILAELGEAVYMYQETAKKQGVNIEYIEPETLPFVMADPNRLKQVFINIIDNAIKYSQEGGHVLVEATRHDIYVQVTVKDTGCGIAAEDLSKVKERFYKANKTVRGSGIGLAIADEIIKQHDGILEIDSKEGAGTSVAIILPFIKPNEPERGSNVE
ncbi:MAG: HAMP domain-containing histidine kinase [Clostridia bacterium]|nr:HAMP domain-containing histidine kinase [Clostridia bacterium]